MGVRELAKWLGGGVLAVALLAWVLRGTDLDALREQLGRVSFAALLVCGALLLAQNLFRAWRWRALLAPTRPDVPLPPLLTAIILGYMASWLVPGRLGEVVRPSLLAGRERLPLGPCLGSVLADRILDGVAVVALFGAGLLWHRLGGEPLGDLGWVGSASALLVAVLALPLGVLGVVALWRERVRAWAARRRGLPGRLAGVLLAVSEGLAALGRPRLAAALVLHTALVWGSITLGTWVGVRACGAAVSPAGVLVLQPLLALGIALPTPGGAGGYHAAMKFGLVQLLGVAPPIAVGAGILVHAAAVVPVVLCGAGILVFGRLSWGDVLAAGRQVRALGRVEEPS